MAHSIVVKGGFVTAVVLAIIWILLSITVAVEATSTPAAPSNLEATATTTGVDVSWDAPGGTVTGYKILRRTPENPENSGWSVYVADTGSASTTWSDSSVSHGDRYIYRVKAINSGEASARSGPASIRWYPRPAETAPGSPSSLTASSTADGVRLSWSAPSESNDVVGYQILRRRPKEGEKGFKIHKSDTGLISTVWTDRDVVDGVKYKYRVKALNGDDEAGAWSNAATHTYDKPEESGQDNDTTPTDGGDDGSSDATTELSISAMMDYITPLNQDNPVPETNPITAFAVTSGEATNGLSLNIAMGGFVADSDTTTTDYVVSFRFYDSDRSLSSDACQGTGAGGSYELYAVPDNGRWRHTAVIGDSCNGGADELQIEISQGDRHFISVKWLDLTRN